jgi:hypothetical protein
MLSFTRHFGGKTDQVSVTPQTLIVAGWTGREEAALQHHIEELAAIGVPPPSTVPVFYRNAVNNVMQTDRLEVLGPDTSGEVEPIIVALADGLWVTVGSDHTDRKAEMMGIALSKQLCGKVLGSTLWRFEEVADHWDTIVIRSYATIDGQRVLYQEGSFAAICHPTDLVRRYAGEKGFAANTVMMCGTLGAIGGIRPAARFDMELEDPVLKRRMAHGYDVITLPVVS